MPAVSDPFSRTPEVVGMEQDIITLQDIFLFEKTGINETARFWSSPA